MRFVGSRHQPRTRDCSEHAEDRFGEPRDRDRLTRVENELGVRLPVEYRDGLAAEGRVVVAGPQTGEEVWLFSVAELSDVNAAANVPDRLPSVPMTIRPGSREMLALDGRSDPPPVVLVHSLLRMGGRNLAGGNSRQFLAGASAARPALGLGRCDRWHPQLGGGPALTSGARDAGAFSRRLHRRTRGVPTAARELVEPTRPVERWRSERRRCRVRYWPGRLITPSGDHTAKTVASAQRPDACTCFCCSVAGSRPCAPCSDRTR